MDPPVGVEVLEAEDVEHADGLTDVTRVAVHLVDGDVDLVDQPDEHASVDRLHQSVPHVHRRLRVELLRDALVTRLDRLRRQRVDQARVVHLSK